MIFKKKSNYIFVQQREPQDLINFYDITNSDI